jgi:hypothetical protein
MTSAPFGARLGTALLAVLSCLAGVPSALAQTQARNFTASESVDWYYATTFGTGVYKIGDRTVTMLRLPFEREMVEPEDGTWGIRLKLPVTLGFQTLSNAFEDVLNRNVATVSAMPGIEFEKEIRPNWWVKPTASFGAAQDLLGGQRSTLYEVGVRSLWSRAFYRLDFSLGNALLYAGNVAQDGLTQHLGVFSTGFNFLLPAGGVLFDRAANVGVHFVHYAFFNRVDFLLDETSRRSVSQQYEFAMTLGTYRPIELMGFELQRIGLGVRLGEGLVAIRLVTGFLY